MPDKPRKLEGEQDENEYRYNHRWEKMSREQKLEALLGLVILFVLMWVVYAPHH